MEKSTTSDAAARLPLKAPSATVVSAILSRRGRDAADMASKQFRKTFNPAIITGAKPAKGKDPRAEDRESARDKRLAEALGNHVCEVSAAVTRRFFVDHVAEPPMTDEANYIKW